jgi:hypothetical protein
MYILFKFLIATNIFFSMFFYDRCKESFIYSILKIFVWKGLWYGKSITRFFKHYSLRLLDRTFFQAIIIFYYISESLLLHKNFYWEKRIFSRYNLWRIFSFIFSSLSITISLLWQGHCILTFVTVSVRKRPQHRKGYLKKLDQKTVHSKTVGSKRVYSKIIENNSFNNSQVKNSLF